MMPLQKNLGRAINVEKWLIRAPPLYSMDEKKPFGHSWRGNGPKGFVLEWLSPSAKDAHPHAADRQSPFAGGEGG